MKLQIKHPVDGSWVKPTDKGYTMLLSEYPVTGDDTIALTSNPEVTIEVNTSTGEVKAISNITDRDTPVPHMVQKTHIETALKQLSGFALLDNTTVNTDKDEGETLIPDKDLTVLHQQMPSGVMPKVTAVDKTKQFMLNIVDTKHFASARPITYTPIGSRTVFITNSLAELTSKTILGNINKCIADLVQGSTLIIHLSNEVEKVVNEASKYINSDFYCVIAQQAKTYDVKVVIYIKKPITFNSELNMEIYRNLDWYVLTPRLSKQLPHYSHPEEEIVSGQY